MFPITVSFPNQTIEELDAMAAGNDTSRAAIIRLAVAHLLRHIKKGEPVSLLNLGEPS